MNKFYFAVVFAIAGAIFFAPKLVFAEQINNYQVDITINQDSSLNITEKIKYDFGELNKHGIFRTIPYSYSNTKGKFKLRLSDFKVTDESGKELSFEQSNGGGETELKIGDADVLISGEHEYDISYKVKRAVNYFEDHDELYWNAIGGGWDIPINKSEVNIFTPVQSNKSTCYVGMYGSTRTDCDISNDGTHLSMISKKVLDPGEYFTIVVSLPVGTIIKPTWQQNAWDMIKDNGIVVLPVIIFVIMFLIWKKYGKDAKGRGTIIPQYEPPQDLSPLYMGTLVDGKVDNRDLAAEIIYLATQGFIKIEHIETKVLLWFKGKDYQLTQLKQPNSSITGQTKKIFDAFFVSAGIESVKLSDFKKDVSFGQKITDAKSKILKELKTQGFYKYNPETVLILGVVAAIFLGALFTILSAAIFGTIGFVSGILSGIIILIFALIMPARTKKGAEMREYILGLKKYLSVAEKDRLNFTDAPDKKPEQFEKLLPYAVALGVEKEWAKQFEGIYNVQPNWYSDSTGAAFNAAILSNSVGEFSSSMQSAVSTMTTSSSGDSGFSGGGGGGAGGGGGGSW